MVDTNFWKGKKVFITGHTGFKGAWLCLWLHALGAEITGYALKPPTSPSLYDLCRIDELINSNIADIRDLSKLRTALVRAKPDIVIHLAAQPIVRLSYLEPVKTYEVNVLGTVNILESIRYAVNMGIPIKTFINVTSDKCYENKEWAWGYRENDPLGGYDPYSNSKACSELITSAYRNSFFNLKKSQQQGVSISSARAGNVIGGGDWTTDRLIPDCVRALLSSQTLEIRNTNAIRPWQHVLEPLSGYLILAQKMHESNCHFAESWNFGPDYQDERTVGWLVHLLVKKWGNEILIKHIQEKKIHEAHILKLDCSKSKAELGWYPKWNLETALDKVIEWTKAYQAGSDVKEVCLSQIDEYSNSKKGEKDEYSSS
ncbi:CDP-glucose 4,6-dehydratase [Peribacillus frigoritolerans]|uniref:CDP-glucose 4,6-dehydratase n=1 Tax=Peribacillus frigoritolerans TaxID=450367 RepID=UPI002ED51447|nr:CDP-glucose 4,6-dehydratase [Peribacillus frigoritolerans]